MPSIGDANLSRDAPPRIIVSITDADRLVPDPAMDIAELRLDALEDVRPGAVAECIRRAREQLPGVPLLGTVRMREELGHWRDSEERRLELFEAIMPLVDGVDVEARAEFLDQVVDLAARHEKGVIVSRHISDDDGTSLQSLLENLQTWTAAAVRKKNCVFKLAMPTPTLQAAGNLLRALQYATKEEPTTAWAMMGMGRQGPLSRIMAAALGSVAIYAYPANSAAAVPGQTPLALTRRCLDAVQEAASRREGLHRCVRMLHKEDLHEPEGALEDSLRWADRQLSAAEQNPDRLSPASVSPA